MKILKSWNIMSVPITLLASLMTIHLVASQCLSENDDLTSIPTYHDITGMIYFDINLFKDIYFHSSPNDNILISPFSIYSSLLLAYFGSAGRTRDQLEQVLGIHDKSETLKTWRVLDYVYKDRQTGDNSNTFVLANRVFIHPKISINPCFVYLLSDELELLDLTQPSKASTRINQFIFERTSGRISNLVEPSNLQRAVSVLANAAAFKGTWHEQFKKTDTSLQRFFNSPEEYSEVYMMKIQGSFKYGKSRELQAEVLELPYSDGVTSMYLLLPGMTTGPDLGLADMMDRLTPVRFRSALTNMGHRKVQLQLPRFKFHNKMKNNLKQSLFRMGIKDLFTNLANLTALAPLGGLTVSQSLHQANIEVNEEGTEASAATIFIVNSRTRPGGVISFDCNRPFLFLIYDNFAGNILFMGAYRKPVPEL